MRLANHNRVFPTEMGMTALTMTAKPGRCSQFHSERSFSHTVIGNGPSSWPVMGRATLLSRSTLVRLRFRLYCPRFKVKHQTARGAVLTP